MKPNLIPVDLWREIASHFKERDDYQVVVGGCCCSELQSGPGSDVVGPLPFPKVHQDLVHLSSTCRYLRDVLGDDVKSCLTLQLTVLDGKVIHIRPSTNPSWIATRNPPIPVHRIPVGPHIRRLCLYVRAVPDVWDTPRKPALLDSIPGPIGSRIRDMHDRLRRRKLQKARDFTRIRDQVAVLELMAPLIATMPNIQNMYLETSITRSRLGGTCIIGEKLMESLAQLRELTTLHLMYARVFPGDRMLPAVRHLQTNCQVTSIKHCFPNLKDLRHPGHSSYYSDVLPGDSLGQLEVLHCNPSNNKDVFSLLKSFGEVSIDVASRILALTDFSGY